jgi:uncharacterized protein (TIGR02246 family)
MQKFKIYRSIKGIYSRLLSITAFLIIFSAALFAQNSELTLAEGVEMHSGVDAIYKTFSRGYRTLDPKLVADLYTADAAYLSPGGEIRIGRAEILKGFTRSFNNAKARKRSMRISFRIYQRQIETEIGYDVGVFYLTYYEKGKLVHKSKGKFVVVAVKESDNKWRFQVDGYSDIKPQNNN